MQVLQPVTAGLSQAVPLLEQTAQIFGGLGKVLPGERLSQSWALLMACLQLFPAFGTVWVPVTATGAIRSSVPSSACASWSRRKPEWKQQCWTQQGWHIGSASARGHWVSWAEVAPLVASRSWPSTGRNPAVQGGCARFCFVTAPDSPTAACWLCVGWSLGGGFGLCSSGRAVTLLCAPLPQHNPP